MNKVSKCKKPYRVVIMAWVLAVAILVPTIVAFASQQTTGKYEEAVSEVPNFAIGNNGESYYNLIKNELPLTAMGQPSPRSITISISGKSTNLYLNCWLWAKKQLVVYGDYTKVPNNNFMCGTAPRNDNGTPVITENAGFYMVSLNSVVCQRHGRTCSHKNSDNTIRGEWEYHGYDVSGNKFSNQPYIGQGAQVNMNQLTLKDWVKNPWDDKWRIKYPDKYAPMSDFNKFAIRSEKNEFTRKWIANSMKPMSEDENNPMVYSVDGTYPDVYNYLNVMQRPTIKNSGSGRMYHVSRNDGQLYYYTFNIPVIKEKEILPTITTIIDIELPNEVPEEDKYKDQEQIINVSVSAIYSDADHIGSEPERQEYYTRFDLESWKLNVTIPTLNYTSKEQIVSHVVEDKKNNTTKNYIQTKFTISVKNSQLNAVRKADGTIDLVINARATPMFKNGVWGKLDLDSQLASIAKPKKNTGNITVVHMGKDDNVLETKKYTNLSYGTYTYESKTFSGYTLASDCPSIQTVSISDKKQTQIVTFLYDYKDNPSPKTISIKHLNISNSIGEIAFDGIPFTDASDSTDMSIVSNRSVYVDGVRVDDSEFFSGNYTFNPTTDKNGYFAKVDVEYAVSNNIESTGYTEAEISQIEASLPSKYVSTDYVYVYPTKPNASFKLSSNSFKQNRIITATDTSVQSNIALVMDRYPLKTTSDAYRWTIDGAIVGDGSTDISMILMYKNVGTYSISLQVLNVLGQWSDPYTVNFQVLEDYKPNIEVNLNESVITRNDTMTAYQYDINSTDGDKIQTATVELWHDSDGDEIVDTKLKEWNGLGDNGICEKSDFPAYTPTKLGLYKYIITAKEEFVGVTGQETILSNVTDADKKTNSHEVEFWVENYVPLSDLYIDAPIVRPNADMLVMLDKDLSDSKRTNIMDSRVNMENTLLKENIIPKIRTWDMKTYVYEQGASTTVNTGGSYPSQTTSYSSNGYSGTLNRTSVSDNGSYHDFGSYKTITESKTATASASQSGTYCSSCNGSVSPTYGSTYSYSDGEGYSGTLSQSYYTYSETPASKCSTCEKNCYHSFSRNWSYSGTVSRTREVWTPNVQWVSNYYGYYSGTIYKYVRQPYTDPWRSSSSKYILYISDGNINELADFNATISKTDAKIILAGTPSIKAQCTREGLFIDTTGKTTEQVLQEALTFVFNETPNTESICILQGQTFNMNVGEMDLDGDNIIDKEFQYVHNSAYYDNPTGIEPATQPIYSDTIGWTTAIKNLFNNVGKYSIYRRVKDLPDGPLGYEYAQYSASTRVDVYVHRKPIALATLDWDFDLVSNTYKTTWVDKSYDLDHQYSDPNKGIVERKIMWKKDSGEWYYTIPDNLSPGTYNLYYYVKDIEGVWSEPWTLNFILAASPPMQFEAKLRSEDIKFRNPPNPVTLPASENLQPYDLWTRYPTNPTLTMAIYDVSSNLLTPIKTINYSIQTALKIDNDINWYPASYTVPATLKDGNYIFKISATGSATSPTVPQQTTTQSKTVQFPVTVLTPINLKANINGSSADALITAGQKAVFNITTSKYVNITQIQFEGETYASSLGQIKQLSEGSSLSGEGGQSQSDSKTWALEVDIPTTLYTSDKTGIAYFKALLPSGKEENTSVNYTIKTIVADNFNITSILDIGWRDFYFDTSKKVDTNGDGIAKEYKKRIGTNIGTSYMPVNYYSLISYPKSFVKAGYKIKGSIDILGNPDSASFRINYYLGGKKCSEVVTLNPQVQVLNGGGGSPASTYTFEWIIPLATDKKSFVSFDLIMTKDGITYGNERWLDNWYYRNTMRNVLYIDGSALDDLSFVQEQ